MTEYLYVFVLSKDPPTYYSTAIELHLEDYTHTYIIYKINLSLADGLKDIKKSFDRKAEQVCFVDQVLRKVEEEEVRWRCGQLQVEFP